VDITWSACLAMGATVALAVTAVLAIKDDRDIDLFGAVVLGLITAIGGGLIRDVLAGRTTLIMRPEIYAVPVCLACIAYVAVLSFRPEQAVVGSLVCIAGAFAFRAASIHWNLEMPAWASLVRESKA